MVVVVFVVAGGAGDDDDVVGVSNADPFVVSNADPFVVSTINTFIKPPQNTCWGWRTKISVAIKKPKSWWRPSGSTMPPCPSPSAPPSPEHGWRWKRRSP